MFFWWFCNQNRISFHSRAFRSLTFFRFFSIIRCILSLINCNSDFKAISLLINSIRYFIFYLRNIFFQFIFLNQDEFSIFSLSFFIISFFNHNSSFLSLIDFNIWFRRFIFSELLEEELLSMTIKYLTSMPWKNVWIIYDFHHDLSNILDNSIATHIFQLHSFMTFAMFFYISQSLIQRITHWTMKFLYHF